MFRKLVLTSAAAIGLAVPMGMTSEANAADIRVQFGTRSGFYAGYGHRTPVYHPVYRPAYRPAEYCYEVEYRECGCGYWTRYGTYHSHSFAHEVVDRLVAQGYEARVAHH